MNVKFNDYLYFKSSEHKGGRIYWYCKLRKKQGCKARIITVKGVINKLNEEHNHPSYLAFQKTVPQFKRPLLPKLEPKFSTKLALKPIERLLTPTISCILENGEHFFNMKAEEEEDEDY